MEIVEPNSLRATDSGYEIRIRLKWYRSLPLSCLEYLKISLDGEPVEPSAITFGVNDHEYSLDELADLGEEFWFILDPAVVTIDEPGRVKPGESHQIDVALGVRAPYIRIGPNKFLTIANSYSAVQVAG